ncbi:MAG: hypothetical protein A2046_03170 [Bacteroidetes bacterium GWA2_30_7]|nr:MAG: hypothetical protein A2046_03170 [Bacteroidetes bacterium GWA2_30_7]
MSKNILHCEDCNVLKNSFFCKIAFEDQKYLSLNKFCSTYKKGMTIFCSGTKPVGVYCLKQGSVKIIIYGTLKEHTIRYIKPGELFGLDSLLTDHNFHCCASVTEDAVVCRVNKQDFFNILSKYPNLTFELMSLLGKLIEEAEHKIISLAQKNVRERTAESLIYFYKLFYDNIRDISSNNYMKNGMYLSRVNIANIVGTSTETVIRMLSEFKNDGYISIKGRGIFIKDVRGLEKIAGN